MVFVKIYRFFTQHKFLLYALMVVSSVVFAFFASKARFEEDLMKLLPKSDESECGLVFGNVKVKDKLFMQMTGAEPEVLVVDYRHGRQLQLRRAETLYRLLGRYGMAFCAGRCSLGQADRL